MTKTRRRKKRTHVPDTPDPSKKGDPKTFVLRRGKHAALLADLEMDVRRMMLPNTALNLQESRRNVLKDFVQGPTLSLRILSYSLMRDTMFQSMFPSINVAKVRLAACQRVVLLALDKATGVIRLRHYTISLAPSGLRKGLKGLLQRSSLPDMSSMQDVAEFMTRGGYGSESEGEEAEASRVTLGQDLGKGNAAGRASRVRLHEVGPRLELQLMKVEEGLCSGAVLYHAL
ncbi:brix domain-containing protein, partial [Haematococcus lacustris]